MNTPDPIRTVGTSPATTAVVCATLAGVFSAPALAYVGPGAGLGVLGTLFGIVAALVLAMFGLFWYPIKRAFARRKAPVAGPAVTEVPPADPSGGGDEPTERGEGERRR